MITNNGESRQHDNRPGLSEIAFRLGDYASFRRRLVAALPTALQASRSPDRSSPLARLTTREAGDPAMAWMDAWSVVADVLTFYQERIANEGYLRTATERRSVLELARAIGYELSPGVAADTSLSFRVEEAPGSPEAVLIPARTQVMSTPTGDELPQIFETSQDFTAHRSWNALRPRQVRPQTIGPGTQQIYLGGTSIQVQAGDQLLLLDAGPTRKQHLLTVQSVQPDQEANHTLVRWRQPLPANATEFQQPQLYAFRQTARLFGYNAPSWELMPTEVKLEASAQRKGGRQGGIVRGHFDSDSDSDSEEWSWQLLSQTLPKTAISCLAVRGSLVLAGTADEGLFRSTDDGQTWEAANAGITSRSILSLHIAAKESVFNEAIFAGTPNGGLFRSRDQGRNWVAINGGQLKTQKESNDERCRLGGREHRAPEHSHSLNPDL
jgi:hypothetical protein